MVEPGRPEAIRRLSWAPWLVVATVSIGAFMGQLDASIVTVALPTLQRSLHTSSGAVEWVGIAYLLVLVGAVTAIGRFADMAGRKLLYTYGFGVFIVGSALCGFAPNLGILVAARVLQAVGAAMLQANSVALITHAMPPSRLGRGIGVQGAAQAVGLAVGPSVGGFLIGLGGWRWIFFVNVPAGLIGITLGWFLLPRSRELAPAQRFDWLGAGLFMSAVVLVMAVLSFASSLGTVGIAGLLAVAALLVAGFMVRERRTAAPMVDLALFRQLTFTAGIASGLLSYLATFGVIYVIPYYLEHALGYGAARAGVELTVLPVALGLVAPFAGRAADRLGARPVTMTGMAVAAVGFAALAVVHDGDAERVVELAVIGLGLGIFTPANNAAIMGSAPRTHAGVAGGMLNMTRGLGTSLGLAATSFVYFLLADHSAGLALASFFLAAVSVAAALLAAVRGSAPIASGAGTEV